ncbi:glucosamine-6-phosphate deaminase [Opitutus sp. GAS368]|jgi:glucosamine-6-phosphate deaminase|uniref:glucosamine-6-phosphate deaminase n=1 Tax=Opitutus sp. GAS368 TaxID=1882749 RepID=UPI00087ACB89|nr:glucosamine-6-phosphate deaminase [Opitutus sp. GAS368]SDR81217.1 glucosamine-6-phosphate deaminase [Opitutus sp. GAS368]
MNTLTPLVRCSHEQVPLAVFADNAAAARAVAGEIAGLIRSRPAGTRPVVLGLATGSTPLGLYAELIRLHREEALSFANVVTFNLDEYYPLAADHPQSYHHFMRTHLFDRIDIPPANVHLPDGAVPQAGVDAHCRAYEEMIAAAGGIDFQILGIGRTGHIGFNEPGSPQRSRTRLVTLDPITRRDAAGDFGGEEHTPRYALTMGVRSILEARRIVLMAWGQHKAGIVRNAVEGGVTAQVTASFLQEHDNAIFILDHAAAGALTRFRTPWLLGPLEDQGLAWDERMTRRAILWLSGQRGKAILKLTDDDYNEAGLQDLLRVHGSAYEANRTGFYQMQHTITGWPGGRDPRRTQPGDAPARPLRASSAGVFPKRVLVLSPHPDDDVISMGGTLCRLVEHGHEVHVAHQVSGANAVSDETLWRTLLFARAAGLAGGATGAQLGEWCAAYETKGALPAIPEVKRWKGLVRRQEAAAAARVCGVAKERLHFLDLPFYDAPVARRLGVADVDIMHRLLDEVRPHLVYAAGDLDDPHGTHRICLHALREALVRSAQEPWFAEAELWLYRGAWAEWELDEIDLAVPLSPQEVLRRRRAIFRHETQKDQALFPGDDRREFWQRTEDRSRRLAESYNTLGLAEYEAIEAFKRYAPDEFLRHVKL